MRNQLEAGLSRMREWRRYLHANPETGFDVGDTAAFVADILRSFGCDEVVEGVGRTGVVAILNGSDDSAATLGMRAELDALPIVEVGNRAWLSRYKGRMHACGHDGHMAMLLGAAHHLAQTREFEGRLAFIFQPAEENGGGGRVMIEDGLMERFGISQVYAMHNLPGLDAGRFAIRKGPIMAASDRFDITINGRGGHAALPHLTVDPVSVAMQVAAGFQTIVSRETDPLDSLVISITRIAAGDAYNVIPNEALLAGTVRTLNSEVQAHARKRIEEIVHGVAAAHGAAAVLTYRHGYPATLNHDVETDFAADVAETVAGADKVNRDARPLLGGEDFSYMLAARPGAFIFIGNGDSESLHHPSYDFNDDILVDGAEYWVRLAQARRS